MSPRNFNFCEALDSLKDPSNVSTASLAASLSAIVATALTCPLIIFLNFLVLLAFYTKPALRTRANVLLCAMATNDLVKGGIGSLLFLAKEITYQMRRQPNCYVNLVSLINSTSTISDNLLALINCERFVGLKFPVWHLVHVTKPRLLFSAAVAFLVGLSASLLRSFIDEGRFVLIFVVIGCTIATLIFAVLTWRVIVRRNQQVQGQLGARQNQPNAAPVVTSADRKAAKIATYLALGFLFTRIIPLALLLTIVFTKPDWMYVADSLLQALALMNSLVNPLIYGLMNKNIKNACLRVIKRK